MMSNNNKTPPTATAIIDDDDRIGLSFRMTKSLPKYLCDEKRNGITERSDIPIKGSNMRSDGEENKKKYIKNKFTVSNCVSAGFFIWKKN